MCSVDPFHIGKSRSNYHRILLHPTMPQQCLTPESSIVLQQIIDVSDPIIFFTRAGAFPLSFFFAVLNNG